MGAAGDPWQIACAEPPRAQIASDTCIYTNHNYVIEVIDIAEKMVPPDLLPTAQAANQHLSAVRNCVELRQPELFFYLSATGTLRLSIVPWVAVDTEVALQNSVKFAAEQSSGSPDQ